jgi:hypothetical protein
LEVYIVDLEQKIIIKNGEEFRFTGNYWKFNTMTTTIGNKKITYGKISENNSMMCDENGKGKFGIENAIDLTRKEKLNQNVNQLLEEFVRIFPETQDEITLTKNKFPTISRFSKFELKWKLTNYLTYLKEEEREEILSEEYQRTFNFRSLIQKSKEILSWF